MVKKLIIIILFGISTNLYAKFLDNLEISFGQNYSEITSTKSKGFWNWSINSYKRYYFEDKFSLKIGISYNQIKSKVYNKSIRTTGNMGSGPYYLYDCNSIVFNYKFIELNTFLQYKIIEKNNFFLQPIIGAGYCLSSRGKSHKKIDNQYYSEEKEFSNSDYILYDDTSRFLINSNFVIHYGLSINYKNYFGNFYYTSHPNMNYGDNKLKIDEKIQSFHFLIGFIIEN